MSDKKLNWELPKGEGTMLVGVEDGLALAEIDAYWRGEEKRIVGSLEGFAHAVLDANDSLLPALTAACLVGDRARVAHYGRRLAALGMAMAFLAAPGETVRERVENAGLPMDIAETYLVPENEEAIRHGHTLLEAKKVWWAEEDGNE